MAGPGGWRCLTVRARERGGQAQELAEQARWLGVSGVTRIERASLVFLRERGPVDHDRLVGSVLTDPLLHEATWERSAAVDGGRVVETVLHAGVTDPVAQAVARGARLVGIDASFDVATGARFEVYGTVDDADLDRLIARLLANPVVEHATVGCIEPHDAGGDASGTVATVALHGLGPGDLAALSVERGLALDPAELLAVQAHFDALGRAATDVELEMLAQTWSEHCAHKTFRARITWADGTEVTPLLKQLRGATDTVAAPWVRSAFVDNAGIVAFDDAVELAIKAETHNHPSAVEPFGGANTGVGGVLRDVLGVSARPIAVTDVLCFGPPDTDPATLPTGVLHPRRIRDGVIAGVADYGNKLGVPTVAGAIAYEPGFIANPLVFCGCVGVLPVGSHRATPEAGDRVVVIGGRTGRDGIRGATFSSMTMDATTGEVAGASVQIGDPIVEKGVLDVVLAARDAGLYHAITDCGAGGLSSAVGEMASTLGADVQLDLVPRKYPGLAPWETWLSEAQERMVLAVAPDHVAALREVCRRYEVELADIGAFTGDGRLVVRDGERVAAELDVHFLHEGRPTRQLVAARAVSPAPHGERQVPDATAALLALLAHVNVRSNQDVVTGYDHEVLGGSVVRPYGGAADDGPTDAAVIVPVGAVSEGAAAIGIGVNTRFGAVDAERMAWSVVDEAIRNVVAVGADPDRIALLDNFSWGDPRRPETLGQLVAAVEGCCAAAIAHGAPYVSGKDSLNNEYLGDDGQRHAIPPTLVIHALGVVPHRERTVTSDAKAPGDVVFLVGRTLDELRGSHLDAVLGIDAAGAVPGPDRDAPARYRRLHAAIAAGLVRAAHDLAEGGLAVAAAEMAMGGRLGLALAVDGDPVVALFSESNGRLLVEVAPDDAEEFVELMEGDALRLGTVTDDATLRIAGHDAVLVEAPVAALVRAWAGHVPGVRP